jgi:hypothetical protein
MPKFVLDIDCSVRTVKEFNMILTKTLQKPVKSFTRTLGELNKNTAFPH